MVTNLFLQGPQKIGKLALVRLVLMGGRADVGDYFVQRLFQRGEYVGLRPVAQGAAGCWQRFPRVFAKTGVQAPEGARRPFALMSPGYFRSVPRACQGYK